MIAVKNSRHMKNSVRTAFKALAAAIAIISLNSCIEGNDYDYSLLQPSAIVTVKPVTSGETDWHYFQLNDEEKLLPTDWQTLPFGSEEVRAFVNYEKAEFPEGSDPTGYSSAVKVNWIDKILTKNPVDMSADEDEDGGNSGSDGSDGTEGSGDTGGSGEENALKGMTAEDYGTDPVEIYADWMTNVEDGYLTIHFFTNWSDSNIKHELTLLTNVNPDDPYEVRFAHNAHGDGAYYRGDGIVAFRLKDLQDTNGETVKLTLKFDSFSGEKTVKFDYRSREDWSTVTE